ncbi:hypothetical protein TNIN_208181 [Trichonephila inaurata madagascariensis]|uniref:Uncharacterized protein n=1 Tax=Trichonephila inaurata madagascariensis TaxID=2747483 RepID=A0A8X7BZ98_9ARAC|nr:hypothetical protein TNIN_208181 [Trichonephila inaurata madagascariensis]
MSTINFDTSSLVCTIKKTEPFAPTTIPSFSPEVQRAIRFRNGCRCQMREAKVIVHFYIWWGLGDSERIKEKNNIWGDVDTFDWRRFIVPISSYHSVDASFSLMSVCVIRFLLVGPGSMFFLALFTR